MSLTANFFKFLKDFGKHQSFQPNLLSIFLNPSLFQRWFLYTFLKKNAPVLTGKVLDFGCGRKPYKNLFVSVNEYIGVDIEISGHVHSESLIDIFYDGEHIPFPNGYFDSLYCSEVIEHLFVPDKILNELNRVLKVDSLCIFTFPFAWQEHEQPYDYARYTSFGAKFLLEKHGFEIVNYEKSGSFLITLWQLWINSIFTLFLTKNRYLNTLLTILFISPFNLIGICISLIPSSKQLYLTNLIIARKKSNKQ